jgi:hypothetical protein
LFYLTGPGTDPTIVSYNASAVNLYSATINLVRFEIKSYYFEKTLYLAGAVVVNSKDEGLVPTCNSFI